MSRPFTMYHKDYARQGREYDHDYHDKAKLEREGWVDSIKEMGGPVWERNHPKRPEHETDS